MADWFYFPRPRYDSQGAPQSPFKGGTPVGNADHGICWTRRIIDPPAAIPHILLGTGVAEGFVLDNTDGDAFDDLGNYLPNTPFPGGTISSITFGSAPVPFSTPLSEYNYWLRSRVFPNPKVLLFSADAAGVGTPGIGWPTYTLNPLTGLAWVATEIMGAAAVYDVYIDVITLISGTYDAVLYDGSFCQIVFTPSAGGADLRVTQAPIEMVYDFAIARALYDGGSGGPGPGPGPSGPTTAPRPITNPDPAQPPAGGCLLNEGVD